MMPSAASSIFAYLSLDGADDDERNRVWVDQLCCVTERINIYLVKCESRIKGMSLWVGYEVLQITVRLGRLRPAVLLRHAHV